MEGAGNVAECPAHPVLSPWALIVPICVLTSLYSDSFRGKKKGRELKRKTAREGEGEQRGRESRSRRETGRGRKNRSARAVHAS